MTRMVQNTSSIDHTSAGKVLSKWGVSKIEKVEVFAAQDVHRKHKSIANTVLGGSKRHEDNEIEEEEEEEEEVSVTQDAHRKHHSRNGRMSEIEEQVSSTRDAHRKHRSRNGNECQHRMRKAITILAGSEHKPPSLRHRARVASPSRRVSKFSPSFPAKALQSVHGTLFSRAIDVRVADASQEEAAI